MKSNHTYNRTTITMIDNSTYRLGSGKLTIDGMKKNHQINTSINGKKYIVNLNNGICYDILNTEKIKGLKLGFYFETTKELASVIVDGFYFTRMKKDAISNFALWVEKTEAWTGYENKLKMDKRFHQHLENIKNVN
jgi:hypothetical protein